MLPKHRWCKSMAPGFVVIGGALDVATLAAFSAIDSARRRTKDNGMEV
jgi:hypothetical protein